MKRVVINANPECMRVYRITSRFENNRVKFDIAEVDLPPEAAAAKPWQDMDLWLDEMVPRVNRLIASENPDSWVLTAPFPVLVQLYSSLSETAKKRLVKTGNEDLTALPAHGIARRFVPFAAAA